MSSLDREITSREPEEVKFRLALLDEVANLIDDAEKRDVRRLDENILAARVQLLQLGLNLCDGTFASASDVDFGRLSVLDELE